MKAQLRGDIQYFTLFCKVPGKKATKTRNAGYGDGSRYCKTGALKIRTYGNKLRISVTWAAPATDSYAAYHKTQRYKT